MASGKKNGGDFALESRHLVGLFLLLVVIFGVVFTLGYLLGRSQYDTTLRAAVSKSSDSGDRTPAAPSTNAPAKEKSDGNEAAPKETGSDWDFYHDAEPKTTEDHLQPLPKKIVPAAQPVAARPVASNHQTNTSTNSSPPLNTPLIPKGAIMLQVAAVRGESDALALAQALQQKKFPAFVLTPGADKFYHVQVGPYKDAQSAALARHDLEANGFKTIVKR